MSTNTLEMTKTEWLKERQKGIGGSDVAAALGLSKYKTRTDLYIEKTSTEPIEIPDNPKMRAGRMLEQVIADYYVEETGNKVQKENKISYHKEYPFLLANIDRLILKDNTDSSNIGRGILECKSSSSFAFNHWEDDIPIDYYFQLMHYLNVKNLSWGAFGVLLNGWDFRIIPIKRNDEIIENMTEQLVKFWNDFVVAGVMPEPLTNDEVTARYQISQAKQIQANELLKCAVSDLKTVKANIKTLTDEQDKLELIIKSNMQDSDELVYGENILATWKQSKGISAFDKTNFSKENGELYNKYLITKPGIRRFVIK